MSNCFYESCLRHLKRATVMLFIVSIATMAAHAQVTTGKIRGIVLDPNGAVVPGAKVSLTRKSTNNTITTQTSNAGSFEFNNLLPADDYTVVVEAQNFKAQTLTDIKVQLNQTTDLSSELTLGSLGETVTVTAGGAELVDTSTSTLAKGFSERQAVDLAQTNVGGAFGGGVNNLALLAPNVSSSGGVGVGTGGSVGGQRPRNNNFMVDGVDNNNKSVTGPSVYVSPEVVQEFSLIQNQFSAEFGHSNGGQFVTVTKSGTNDFHTLLYGYFRNRFLSALDARQIDDGFVREQNVPGKKYLPRFDYFRGGGNVGGPVILPKFGEGGPSTWRGKDRLFFFSSWERLQTGFAAVPAGITALTANALATVAGTPGVSATNLGIYRQFVPIAATNNAGTIDFCRVRPAIQNGSCAPADAISLPIGTVDIPPQPQFIRQNNFVLNLDFTQSSKTQHHARYNWTNNASISLAGLPIFNEIAPLRERLFSYTLFHSFSPSLSNETRLAYRRYDAPLPVTTSFRFPGLDTTFPNIGLLDLGVDIGPPALNPQTNIENNYQVVNNVIYTAGQHSFKFGGDFRQQISPQTFTQRARGDYQYSQAQYYFFDQAPDFLAQRSVGDVVYYGNQKVLYAFAQDDWRVRPNLSLNLGINYSYQQPPLGTQLQALNSIASVPGLIDFHAPRLQKNNFGPRIGFAYSPNFRTGILARLFGAEGRSSIRAGFSKGYDYLFDNLPILALPPQVQQTIDLTGPPYTTSFLANGGIRNVLVPSTDDVAAARANTGSFMPDQDVPYALTWTGSIQRQIGQDWSIEVRYLGTKGAHLFTQSRINRQGKVSPELGGLPTFFSAPTQAQLNSLSLGLSDIDARSSFVPAFLNAGFTSSITSFPSNGSSIYHGGSAQLTRRFSDGLQMTGAYTWSHLIDDSTAEVFATVLSPRRTQEFQNLQADRSDSAIDRRHRFVSSVIYDVPWFRTSEHRLARMLLGGFSLAGTFTAESGEKATVLSGTDSNLNGDSAPDRTIINPAGIKGTGSDVMPLCRIAACGTAGAGDVVGYLALNPNAQYIKAGFGAVANAGRNTLQLPGINNVDFSVFKNFRFGETRRIQLRSDFFNLFNHPQYIPGSPNEVIPVGTAGVNRLNTVTSPDLGHADRVFFSNSRIVQLALRFEF